MFYDLFLETDVFFGCRGFLLKKKTKQIRHPGAGVGGDAGPGPAPAAQRQQRHHINAVLVPDRRPARPAAQRQVLPDDGIPRRRRQAAHRHHEPLLHHVRRHRARPTQGQPRVSGSTIIVT